MKKSETAPDVVIVRKRSAVERYGSNEPRHLQAHEALMQLLERLMSSLHSHKLNAEVFTLRELAASRYAFYGLPAKSNENELLMSPQSGLVISVGGDGTLLHASHYIGGNVKLLGVNAFRKTSVGHLCLSHEGRIEQDLTSVLTQKKEAALVRRLQIHFLDGKRPNKLPLALNDVLVCNAHPAGTSRYEAEVHEEPREGDRPLLQEEHTCSGAWISTPSGSTAAISSYGLRPLPLTSSQFLFAVREPYHKPESFSTLDRASFDGERRQLLFRSQMSQGLIAVDGADFTATFDAREEFLLRMPRHMALSLYI